MIKTVIFDMDGLLVDSEPVYFDAWVSVCADLGYVMTRELWYGLLGTNSIGEAEYLKKLYGDDCPVETIRKNRVSAIISYVEKNGIALKPGVIEFTDFLHTKGITTAIATSSDPERTELYLRKTGIGNRFDSVTCGNEVVLGKPAPDLFLKAAEKSNTAPSECAVLEDSQNGLIAAYNAGMKPIWIPDMQKIDNDTLSKCAAVAERMDLLNENILNL